MTAGLGYLKLFDHQNDDKCELKKCGLFESSCVEPFEQLGEISVKMNEQFQILVDERN